MSATGAYEDDLRGVANADFLALGLGGTSMMSMLWAIATGRRAVGVEMRGDPFLGVHWNIRSDLYHQLGLIDKLMLERYGEARIPRRGHSDRRFCLAETFYSTATRAGDIVADEIIDGFDMEQHIVGTIHHVEFVDDRWRDGIPSRAVTLLTPPRAPEQPDESLIRTNMVEVLDGPSTFQAGASSLLVLLRRYLEKMEQMDLEGGFEPRVRLFTRHRVVNTADGIVKLDDGRVGFRIEALQELDYRGKFVRVRRPGSQLIDLGVPELFMIAQGFHSTDAERLGFKQEDVIVDHHDGRGPVVAQADFLAGLLEALVGGRLRRRISSEFDELGNEYWVRQIAVGHEEDPEVGWCLVQVPDFQSFDPVQAGLVPEDTDTKSPEFFAAYEHLLYEFYVQHVADILELPPDELRKIQMVYGPKLFTLIERMGENAQVAPNGIVAGDSFGNGHFLTSGGAMTGMIGHSWRVYEYFHARDSGTSHDAAIRTLADRIKVDTQSWLQVSAREYSEAVPINFGAERIAQIELQSGISSRTRAASIDASRRQRHALLPLDPSDWRRLFLRNGKVFSAPLPELHAVHPALRAQQQRPRGEHIGVVFLTRDVDASTIRFIDAALGQPGVQMTVITSAPESEIPEAVRERLVAVRCVDNVADVDQIVRAIGEVRGSLGSAERVLSRDEDLAWPLAQVRERLGIRGPSIETGRRFSRTSHLRETLVGAGLPVPRYALIESVEDGLAFGTDIGYYPLLVQPDARESAVNAHRVESEDELRKLLQRLHPDEEHPLICEEWIGGQECTLEVISIGGVPAWFSAARLEPVAIDVTHKVPRAWTIVLPREQDDPADAVTRRMGFTALKALGVGTGMSSLRWRRRPDGSRVITGVSAGPPAPVLLALMSHAFGADMYRVWSNTVVNGVFAPIPRLRAAGAVFYSEPSPELDRVVAELGDLVVERRAPSGGASPTPASHAGGYTIVRGPDTAAVEKAVEHLSAALARG